MKYHANNTGLDTRN